MNSVAKSLESLLKYLKDVDYTLKYEIREDDTIFNYICLNNKTNELISIKSICLYDIKEEFPPQLERMVSNTIRMVK